MFTLEDSIRNVYHYILGNYKYLLDDHWECRENGINGKSHYKFYHDGYPVVDMTATRIIISSESVLCEFVKAFNIPDFHVQVGGFSGYFSDNTNSHGYQSIQSLYCEIRYNPLVDSSFLYLDDGLSEPEDEDSPTDTQFLSDVINNKTLIGIVQYTDVAHIRDYLFEHMPNLKYVWVDGIEYSRNDGIITSCKFDYRLRIISLCYRNKLLEGDYEYKKRYCVYNKSYSKR